MRALLVALTVLAFAACGSAPRAAGSATPQRTAAAASPTPINVDDMMGFYPQQTVFVADVNGVSAVTLLNHFTRYTIPTRGVAELASDTTTASSWLYVLDGMEAAMAHVEGATVRLRTFDIATGIERASRTDIGAVASLQRAIATAADGRVLVLKADARHAWIDAYERLTLKPLGPVMEKAGCGDRLVVSASRVAIACLQRGEIGVGALGAAATTIDPPMPSLAAVAMAQDGTIYAVTADRHLSTAPPGATSWSPVAWPAAWTGTVLPDGIALATVVGSAVIVQTDTDGSWLRVLATSVQAPRASFRLAGPMSGAPQGGIMALYPFAYFASGGSIRHVEIQSGMLETMTELGQGATIAAVVDR